MDFECKIISDFGTFTPIKNNTQLKSFSGEKVSIFSIDPTIKISSKGLKYNLNNIYINNLYSYTLNESIGDFFEINISQGCILVYQAFSINNDK